MMDFDVAEGMANKIGNLSKDALLGGAIISYSVAAFAIVMGTGFVIFYRIK